MRKWCLLGLVAITFGGCKQDDAKPTPTTTGSAATTASEPGVVEIFVDDQQVGKIATKEVGLWPRLDTLVPVSARRLGTWQTITLKGAAASTDVQQPSSTHPDLIPALFPGEAGKPAFGMFDPVELAKHGKPALREDGIVQVRIKLAQGTGRGENEHGEGGGGDPRKLVLTIKTAKGEQVIGGETLLAMERQPMPGEAAGDAKGWPLSVILDKAGVKSYQRLLLTGESGSTLTLEKQDLDPKSSVPYVKLNRQGSLRFRVYKKQGETWQAAGDLRGLARVEVLK